MSAFHRYAAVWVLVGVGTAHVGGYLGVVLLESLGSSQVDRLLLWVAACVASGALLGGLAVVLLAYVERQLGDGGTPGWMQVAWPSRRLRCRGDDDLPHRIVAALTSLPANLVHVDVASGVYVARTTMRWRWTSEDVTVQLRGERASPVLVVSSRPTVPVYLFDYGTGLRNVQHVLAGVAPGSGASPDGTRPRPAQLSA